MLETEQSPLILQLNSGALSVNVSSGGVDVAYQRGRTESQRRFIAENVKTVVLVKNVSRYWKPMKLLK